ncbi:hypothetical protein LCGC14_0918630 [marine sediment metagenome]|uniref:Uncharacterized protein n=1 Tax=marine sediment metagenome TaxID=412755 RepID=A0A0F9NRM1_9ZZZZ
MIKDNSGLPAVGLALLRANLHRLTPAKSVEMKGKMLVVVGPEESFESTSFPPGSAALATALGLLGLPRYIEIPSFSGAMEAVEECTPKNPCCDRRNEYNGLASGPLKFTCPKHCGCHD